MKSKKIFNIIKNMQNHIKNIENIYNDETFNIDSIPIYDKIILKLYNLVRNSYSFVMIYNNSNLKKLLQKIILDLNQLNYSIRTLIILVYYNELNNIDEQGLINFSNIFNIKNTNYILDDQNQNVSLNDLKKIFILNNNLLLIQEIITFDFENTNLIILKNKIDYIVESLINNIKLNLKNIIKIIEFKKKINNIENNKNLINLDSSSSDINYNSKINIFNKIIKPLLKKIESINIQKLINYFFFLLILKIIIKFYLILMGGYYTHYN